MTDLLKYADAAVVPHHGGVPLMDRSAQALLYVRLSVCDPSVHLGAFFPLSPNEFRFVALENHAVGDYARQGKIRLWSFRD